MNWLYIVSGASLLAVAGADIVWTTLWVQGGAGPLTSRLMNVSWRALRRVVGGRRTLLTLSGPLVLAATLAVWIGLLVAGWALLFAGGESALVDTQGAGPVSWSERIYFTTYTLFTLGNGGYAPSGGVWRLLTAAATASGMLLVTLLVTYVLSVLDAVTQKRAFASSVSGLGERSEAILRRSWDGEDFDGLDLPLNTLASELDTLTANHKAYPILHYFHSRRARNAPAVNIVVLDEMLTTLRHGTTEGHGPPDVIVDDARSSVEDYLETLHSAFIDPADSQPPAPPLSELAEAGLPTVSEAEFEDALDGVARRRRRLRGLVESDRREWPNATDGTGS